MTGAFAQAPRPALESVIAQLLTDPFFLTLDQIAKLTDWQINALYFHPREDDGRIKPRHDVPDVPLDTDEQKKATLYAMGQSLRIPAEELDRAWADYEQRKKG